MRAILILGCAALLAACGASPGEAPATAETETPEAAAPATAAAPAAEPAPTPAPPLAPSRSAETVPTRTDSLAAAREDVSPEWKMRERQRPGYADCIEKTRNASAEARPVLVEACNRLPDAPS